MLALTVALSGCFNLKYYDSTVPGPGQTHKVWVHSFIGGLVSVGEMDFRGECPTGVYKMNSNHTFVDLLLAGITAGIYTPMNVVYTCGSGPPPAQ
jgi:hypothetical protein